MQKKEFNFFNIPKEYGAQGYKEAARLIIDKYSSCDGMLSVYNWGSPSIPGISDLDIVFVFRQDAKPLPFSRRSFSFLGSKVRYMARHPFVFIDESSFKMLRCVYPDASLKLLHGKNVKISNLTGAEKSASQASLLNDIAIRHYPRDFLGQYCSRSINVRDTLLRLNSLKYTSNSLERLTGKKSIWDDKLRLVEKLRKEWFAKRDFVLLLSLAGEAVGMTMDIIEAFREFLVKNGMVKIISGSSLEYSGNKNKSLFVRKWDKGNALKEMSRLAKAGRYCSVLPLEFAAQLAEYSGYDGLISRHIRSNIRGRMDYRLKNRLIAEKRIKIFNRQALLASSLRHSDFPAFFDFGYRSSSGINNMALSVIDRMRF